MTIRPALLCAALACALLAGCSAGEPGAFPALMPTAQIEAEAATELTPHPAPGLEARAASLRARAAWLRTQN